MLNTSPSNLPSIIEDKSKENISFLDELDLGDATFFDVEELLGPVPSTPAITISAVTEADLDDTETDTVQQALDCVSGFFDRGFDALTEDDARSQLLISFEILSKTSLIDDKLRTCAAEFHASFDQDVDSFLSARCDINEAEILFSSLSSLQADFASLHTDHSVEKKEATTLAVEIKELKERLSIAEASFKERVDRAKQLSIQAHSIREKLVRTKEETKVARSKKVLAEEIIQRCNASWDNLKKISCEVLRDK